MAKQLPCVPFLVLPKQKVDLPEAQRHGWGSLMRIRKKEERTKQHREAGSGKHKDKLEQPGTSVFAEILEGTT